MSDIGDLGGKREFFGPIVHTDAEPAFHEEWERRVFGIATFMQTLLGPNFDTGRAAIEALPPDQYFGPYYQRWLGMLEQMLRPYTSGERSVPRLQVMGTARVLDALLGRPRLPRIINTLVMPRIVGGAKRSSRAPRFAIGDEVRVRASRNTDHTRQPGYVTGRLGTVTALGGAAVFADTHAATGSKEPEHLYTVAFDGAELWGTAAEANTEIRIDLFEPYLEPA